MKNKMLIFNLRDESLISFFPKYRVKNKLQIIEILFEACRYILFEDLSIRKGDNMLILNVDKMSRLFFISKDKSYSINFPFFIYVNDKERSIMYKDLMKIDSRLISDVLSLIKDKRFESDDYLDFADTFVDIDDLYLGRIWVFLKDLLLFEDGYLRVDRDPIAHKKAKDEGKEHTHPENHIDIYYSSGITFKIGLKKIVSHNFLLDLLDTKTDCTYFNH